MVRHCDLPTFAELLNKDGTVKKHVKEKKTKSKKKQQIEPLDDIIIPLPEEDPGFEMFARWFGFPRFRGLFDWQKEHHEQTWESIYEETLVPRDHGKSVEYTWKYEWALWYKNFDVLLLGWTDRRKEVAFSVYVFFERAGLIEKDKRTSPFHFRLKNGGKFDCYLITSKDTLGMHSLGRQDRFENLNEEDWIEFEKLFAEDENKVFDRKEIEDYLKEYKKIERKLWISIDDPIDSSFMKEMHKELSLELHFNSSLYPIHPDKWSFTGTHKFEEDFFDFIEKKFEDELSIYKRSTRNKFGDVLCHEKFTHPDCSTFKMDIKKKKIDLAKIRRHVGEYTWFSEYEQDPHPITGDVWDHVKIIDLLQDPVNRNYDICFISIDRATTMKSTSSFTGCIIGLRNMNTGQRIITHDWTKNTTLEELLIRINNFVIDFKKKYENIRIVLIVEKQGGGDDFIEMVRSRVQFLYQGKYVPNKIGICAELIPLHNTGEKIQRIHDRLYLGIKNELLCMMSTLEHSELLNEILKFPYYPKLDAIDALANMEYELQKIPLLGGYDPFLDLIEAYDIFEHREDYVKTPQQKKEAIKSRIKRGKKRNVFDDW